jgi:hypothetical protein
MGLSPVRGIRVMTWITRIRLKSKVILKKVGLGERTAMGHL